MTTKTSTASQWIRDTMAARQRLLFERYFTPKPTPPQPKSWLREAFEASERHSRFTFTSTRKRDTA